MQPGHRNRAKPPAKKPQRKSPGAAVGLSLLTLAVTRPFAQGDAAAIIARVEGAQTPNRQGLDALTLQEVMGRAHVPGVSVAVVKDFAVHWTKTYGVADAETGRPVASTTRFQVASISKPITAMAAVRLAQDRRLDRRDRTAHRRGLQLGLAASAAGTLRPGAVTPSPRVAAGSDLPAAHRVTPHAAPVGDEAAGSN